jgi:hypothetical protein
MSSKGFFPDRAGGYPPSISQQAQALAPSPAQWCPLLSPSREAQQLQILTRTRSPKQPFFSIRPTTAHLKTDRRPIASISPDFDHRREKTRRSPYRALKSPYCTVFPEFPGFGGAGRGSDRKPTVREWSWQNLISLTPSLPRRSPTVDPENCHIDSRPANFSGNVFQAIGRNCCPEILSYTLL